MSRWGFGGGVLSIALVLALIPLFHSLPAVSGDTLVPAKVIWTNQTWNLSGSPYHLQGDVNVSANATLTIEAGVRVLFDGYYTLRIFGDLMVLGNRTAPVQFGSNATNPLPHDWNGVVLEPSSGAAVSNASLSFATNALWVRGASEARIDNVSIDRSFVGLEVWNVSGLTVRNSTLSDNTIGARLTSSNLSRLESLRITANEKGLIVRQSNDNVIMDSNIFLNTEEGIVLESSDRNMAFGNVIFDNAVQALDDRSSNDWDAGYPTGGNFWSDYSGVDMCSGLGQDVCPDPDGLGDTPFFIDADSVDRYPLILPGADLPPIVNLVAPVNGSLIVPGFQVIVRVADLDLTGAEYVVDDGPPTPMTGTAFIDTSTWVEGLHSLEVSAWDAQGSSTYKGFEIWVDATPPLLGLLSPDNGSTVRPGTIIDLEVTDANLDAVTYSLDGTPPAALPSPFNLSTVDWVEGDHTLRVVARDLAGNEVVEVFEFHTDGTAPRVAAAFPWSGAANVPRDVILYVVFSEPMDQSSVEGVLGLPNLGPYVLEWSLNGTRLNITPQQDLEPGRSYQLSLGATAEDLAGNPLGETLEVRFTILGEKVDGGDGDGTVVVPLEIHILLVVVSLMAVFTTGLMAYWWRQAREARKAAESRESEEE